MRIVIISDTHDNLSAVDKLSTYLSKLDAELMVHLGDYVSPFTLRKLLTTNVRFLGIFGNNDGDKVLMLKVLGASGEIHEPPTEVNIDGLRVLMMHGYGSRELTERFAHSLALSQHYDLIMFGHTHTPKIERVGNSVLLNPGALSGYLTEAPTLAFINTEEFELSLINANSGTVLMRSSFKVT